MDIITYHKEGDYLIPDLIMENSYEDYHIGKYGRLRLNYIKEYKRGLYTELMLNGTLSKHLADIENTATSKIDLIVKQLAEAENIDEALKMNVYGLDVSSGVETDGFKDREKIKEIVRRVRNER